MLPNMSRSSATIAAARPALSARRPTTNCASVRADFRARNTLKIRKSRTARPMRSASIVGMLDSRSIHPHVTK
jgi:hypothetical protein